MELILVLVIGHYIVSFSTFVHVTHAEVLLLWQGKCFLIPQCMQLPMGTGLVQKRAVLSAVGVDRGRITFSLQTKGKRVCLEAYRHHLFNQVSVHLFGSLLETHSSLFHDIFDISVHRTWHCTTQLTWQQSFISIYSFGAKALIINQLFIAEWTIKIQTRPWTYDQNQLWLLCMIQQQSSLTTNCFFPGN